MGLWRVFVPDAGEVHLAARTGRAAERVVLKAAARRLALRVQAAGQDRVNELQGLAPPQLAERLAHLDRQATRADRSDEKQQPLLPQLGLLVEWLRLAGRVPLSADTYRRLQETKGTGFWQVRQGQGRPRVLPARSGKAARAVLTRHLLGCMDLRHERADPRLEDRWLEASSESRESMLGQWERSSLLHVFAATGRMTLTFEPELDDQWVIRAATSLLRLEMELSRSDPSREDT